MVPAEPMPTMLALDDPRWCSFVAESAEATPFHDPGWAELLALTYGYRGFAVAAADGDGHLVLGASSLEVRSLSRRRRWISLPFTDERPPLAAGFRVKIDGFGWRTGADAVIHELVLSAV